jgi:hypothetical protein
MAESSPRAIDQIRRDNKFKFHIDIPAADDNPRRNYFLLGTDCKCFKNEAYYDYGETLTALHCAMPGSVIVDGPETHFDLSHKRLLWHNSNRVASHSVGLMLADISKGVSIINIAAHSRGGIEALIICFELDRIQQQLKNVARNAGESDGEFAARIRIIIAQSTMRSTKSILEHEMSNLDNQSIIRIVDNIPAVKTNLCLLDQVPGNMGIKFSRWQDPRICPYGSKHFKVAAICKELTTFFAQDERTHGFDPAILGLECAETRLRIDTFLGHHGTASGRLYDRQGKDADDVSSLRQLERKISTIKSYRKLREAKKKQALDNWIKTNLGENYLIYIKKKLFPRFEYYSFDRYSAAIHKKFREDLSLVQQTTLSRLVEFFTSHNDAGSIVIPGQEQLDADRSLKKMEFLFAKINRELVLMNEQAAQNSEYSITRPLSAVEEQRLNDYNILAYLKKRHFAKFRKTYFDGLYRLSSDKNSNGRQARLGRKASDMQKHVWVPGDDSPFVNAEHRDLILRKKLLEPCEDDSVAKLIKVIANVMGVVEHANPRSRHTDTCELDPLDKKQQDEIVDIISKNLASIVETNDSDAILTLRRLIKKLKKLSNIKTHLFKEVCLGSIDLDTEQDEDTDDHDLIDTYKDALGISKLLGKHEVKIKVSKHAARFLHKLIKSGIESGFKNHGEKIKEQLEKVNDDLIYLNDELSSNVNLSDSARTQYQRRAFIRIRALTKLVTNTEYILGHNLQFDTNQLSTIMQQLQTSKSLIAAIKGKVGLSDVEYNNVSGLELRIELIRQLYESQKQRDDTIASLKKERLEKKRANAKLQKIKIINMKAIRLGFKVGLIVTAVVGSTLFLYFVAPVVAPVLISNFVVAKSTIVAFAAQFKVSSLMIALFAKIAELAVAAYNFIHIPVVVQAMLHLLTTAITIFSNTLASIALIGSTSSIAVAAKSVVLTAAAGLTAGLIAKECSEAIALHNMRFEEKPIPALEA